MQHKQPCATCPFKRTTKPGTLGGSPTQVYVGQTEGGFAIPCHERIDYNDPNWRQTFLDVGQCAGAAIFRSNIGKASPRTALVLPADPETVFASHAEFVAHHDNITVEEAERQLAETTPRQCVEQEYRRAGVMVRLVPREYT